MRRSVPFSVAAFVLVLGTTSAVAALQRTLNGPAGVTPGRIYTFYVSGFTPGEEVYPTVQPVSCARSSEKCEQSPCPACATTTIGASGTTMVRFRWPRTSIYSIANMDTVDRRWQPGSRALVRIDLASRVVPRGCQRMASTTANPQAGSTVCAATLTQIR